MPVGSPIRTGTRNPFSDTGGVPSQPVTTIIAPAPSGSDDLAMIQALINTYNPLNMWVRVRQAEYLITGKIIPAAGFPLLLSGYGHRYARSDGSSIKLIADLAAGNPVVDLTENYSSIVGLRIDSNRHADYGIYVHADVSHLIDIGITNALLDGVHCSATGVNQAIETSYLFSYENGKLYATAGILGQYAQQGSALVRQPAIAGLATTVATGDTITIVGGPDLTTLGVRGGDILRVGAVAATAYFGQIASVTANTVVVQPLNDNRPTISAAGQEYAIGIGFGWFEELNGDGGFCYLDRSWFRANGAMGIWANSLYGDHITDCYTDFNCSGGTALGICWNNGTLREVKVGGVYTEGCIGPDYLLGNVSDGIIENPGGGNAIFSVCGSQAQIAIIRNGRTESQQLGADQNFLWEFTNVGGTVKHRYSANHFGSGGFASLAVDRVTGATTAFTATPTVDATHDFAAGAGLFSAGGVLVALLNTSVSQNLAPDGMVHIEFDNTGIVHGVTLEVQQAVNVNGVTRNWTALYLLDANGVIIDWNAANIVAGKTISVRFNGKLK